MPIALTSLTMLSALPFDDLIDVRSPAEYAEDHVPGAVSLPVLSNEERAEVGTIYTQVDRFLARKIGAAHVSRNAAAHLEGPLSQKDGAWRPLVYCWRGGQRSGSFASILAQIGWRVDTLEGGYRSYRRLVVAAVHDNPLPHRFILLDGNTGTAKTEILAMLAARGHQVIDLEGLSGHRGSVFGAMTPEQPTQKIFDGQLACALAALDPSRPVLLEAESNKIGSCHVPPSLWEAMGRAPRIRLHAPLDERARYLVRAYADLTAAPETLLAPIAALKPMQGGERVARWEGLVAAGAYETLARELMADHYDPRYAKSRRRAPQTEHKDVRLDRLTPDGLTESMERIEEVIGRLSKVPESGKISRRSEKVVQA